MKLRHVAAMIFFVFGLAALFLILHRRPFFDGVVCLMFWSAAFLFLPSGREGRSNPLRLVLLLLMLFVAATLPGAWHWEREHREAVRQRAQELEQRMTR